MIERVFQAAAVLMAAAAIYAYWNGYNDGMFVSAVLACLAFFLIVRFQVKARNAVRESELEAARASESSDP